MARLRHELPTHLSVEDRLLLGLSARQVMYLVSGLAGGYGLWHQWPELPAELRLGLAAGAVLLAVITALVRPGGRGLDQWLFVVLHHLATPKRCTWRVAEPDPAGWRPPAGGWAELAPRVAWTEGGR
jgi:hypothetical protein